MSHTKERWQELAGQAANEHDTTKLLALVSEINRLLKEKHDGLSAAPSSIGQ